MARLRTLSVTDLRILRQVTLEPAPSVNLIVGPNASGKTSLLEAVHILARGRSFREIQWRAIIREGAEALRVVGRVETPLHDIPLGIEHDRHEAVIRINGEPQRSAKALIEQLPLQLVHGDSHRLIEQGPAYRRQYLDWGVFHVEPRFYGAWQRYRRALRQRNAALRQAGGARLLEPWEEEMAASAEAIDRYRSVYVTRLLPYVQSLGRELLRVEGLGIHYVRGWRSESLRRGLQEARESDRQLGYTRAGPHRADLDLTLGQQRAAQRVSRGQQKALVFALLLAQAQLLSEQTGQRPVLLIDDIAAELDAAHLQRIWSALRAASVQLWVTGTDIAERLAPSSPAAGDGLFHVEHGTVTRVL